jgi:hypothetical protein
MAMVGMIDCAPAQAGALAGQGGVCSTALLPAQEHKRHLNRADKI